MPEMTVTGATTFTQIQQQFGQGKDAGHHIRFEGQELYTSSKASLTGIKAFFGDRTAMDARVQKRDAGVAQIKAAIDRETNTPGMGDRALQRLTQMGADYSHGIRGTDLTHIRDTVRLIRAEDQQAARQLNVDNIRQTRGAIQANQALATQAATALQDPTISQISSNHAINPALLLAFCTNHFDVVSSPEFFAPHSYALSNSDNFGCALSMSVLDRIEQNGTVTQQDLNDLQKVLCPSTGFGSTPAPVPSAALVGPLTDASRSQLTKLVFDRYMAPDAPNLINWENRPFQNEVRDVFARPGATGQERLDALRGAFNGTMTGQYIGQDNFSAPLTSIVNYTWGLSPDTDLKGVTV